MIARTEEEATRFKALAMDAQEQRQDITEQAGAQVEAAQADAALARETAAKEVQEAKEALARARDAQEQSAKLAALAEEAAAAAKAKAADFFNVGGWYQLKIELSAGDPVLVFPVLKERPDIGQSRRSGL
jgi:hypothetical protein